MTFKPWTGRFFGLLFCGAMERKTGLSKWRILSRIVAAQFRGFGLAALAYDFFRFVSWPLGGNASAHRAVIRPELFNFGLETGRSLCLNVIGVHTFNHS